MSFGYIEEVEKVRQHPRLNEYSLFVFGLGVLKLRTGPFFPIPHGTTKPHYCRNGNWAKPRGYLIFAWPSSQNSGFLDRGDVDHVVASFGPWRGQKTFGNRRVFSK
jgi:hypothetical protein